MLRVKQIDHKAIFEKAAGHPAESKTKLVIHLEKASERSSEFSQTHTMNGKPKPVAFSITPRRREQFYI